MSNVAENNHLRPRPVATERAELAPTPTATKMRELLGWVASNVEHLVEDDVGTYQTNSLRSQVMQLLALANDVEELEVEKRSSRCAHRALATVSVLAIERNVGAIRERLNEAAAAFVRVDGSQIQASDDYADPMIRGDFSVAIAMAHKDLDGLMRNLATAEAAEDVSAAAEE